MEDDQQSTASKVSPLHSRSEKTETTENRAYKALVSEVDDLEGMIAYSIYKRDKIDWIVRARASTDDAITDEYLNKHFYPHHLDQNRLDFYLRQATEMLDISFDREVEMEVAEVVEDIRTDLIGSYLNDQTTAMSSAISKEVSNTLSDLHKSRRRGILDGVAASMGAAIILFVLQQGYIFYSKNQDSKIESVASTSLPENVSVATTGKK